MSEAILVALISLVGTIIGSFAGTITSAKLTNYRLSELEKKLEPLIERTHDLEKQTALTQERLRLIEGRQAGFEKPTRQFN